MGGIAFIIVAIGFVIVVFVRLFSKNSQPEQECLGEVVEKKTHEKPVKPQRKPQKVNVTSKPKNETVNVKVGTATALGGAVLAHQMWKHHKHNDTKDISDDRLDDWDDGVDELYDDEIDDVYDYDDNTDYERADYEEQAAYDDFIASMDMDD